MRRLLLLPTLLLSLVGIAGAPAITSAASPADSSTVTLYSGVIGSGPTPQLRPGALATSRVPDVGTLAWHVICITQYGFCAEFPYVAGSQHNFEHHTDYTSATSVSGHLVNYTGNVWVADRGHGYCLGEFTKGCNLEGSRDQWYFVEIIHSKYADPWQALSAINGGVSPHPVFIRVHGYLTCRFAKGIYGGPGITVWAHHLVYYLESGNLALKPNPHGVVERFENSIRFTHMRA